MKLCVHDGNTLPDTHKKFYDEIRNSFGFIAKNVYPTIVPKFRNFDNQRSIKKTSEKLQKII